MEFISSKDGTPIAYRHGGAGASLLLVHGTTGDHLTWAPVSAALERHFSVWVIDRRGRGFSGDAADYTLEREAEDIVAVIDAIGGAVQVIGHSFGGLCALEAALLTSHISQLILYEPPISLLGTGWSAAVDAEMEALLNSGDKEAALLLFLCNILKTPPDEITAMQNGPNWQARVAAAHTVHRELRSIDRYDFDPLRFRTLLTPTLLLLGSESPPRRHTIAKMLNDALPDSRIGILQGQQHSAIRTAPDLFVNEVVSFLRR
ncbi:MAG: alpha/beta fold hydrolase [Methylobacter sp.]